MPPLDHPPVEALTPTQARLVHEKPIALRLKAEERAEVFVAAEEDGGSASGVARQAFRIGWAILKERRAVLRGKVRA